MKRIALLIAACGTFLTGQAQISITGGSLNYTQDFDGLDTATSVVDSTLPNGWAIFEYGTSTTRVNNKYTADSGASNTGDTYSYGTRGTTERALGSLASGSVASNYGAKFVNNTGAAITSITVRYRGEQWRMGATARANMDSLRFFWSTSATDVSDTLASKWTLDTNLTFTTPNMAATGGMLNGNLSANTAVKSGTITTSIPNGGTFVIRWFDPNVLGADDGLAVDSLSITFTTSGLASPRPVLTGFTPAANATGVSPSTNLTLTFNKPVVAGTGSIYIKNRTTQTTNTIAANSSNVTIASNVVTVSGLGLTTNAVYHVTFDSTAFDSASYHSYGLYDSTAWKFTTATGGVRNIAGASMALSVVNPALNGTIILSCNMAQAAVITARVYDLNGRVVAVKSFSVAKGDNRLPIYTTLSAGTYLIRVDDGNEWGAVKVTMQ